MAGFSFTSLPPRPGVRDPFAKPPKANGGITPPNVGRNPFWGQAAGKPWDPMANAPVQGGPVRYTGPTPASLPPGLAPGSQNPGQTAGTSGTQTSQPQLPPEDATSLANIANNQFNVGNQINTLQNRTIPGLQQALAASLGQLDYQQPRDELSTEQNANRLGALYSSVYNQNLGNLIHQYSTQRDTLTTNEGAQETAARDQIAALRGGIPLYNQQQSAAAAQRLITAAANSPATGQPVPPGSGGGRGGSGSGQATGAASGGRPNLQARAAAQQSLAARMAEAKAVAQARAGRRGFSSTVRRVK